ncbi:hypothetical protein BGZ46_005849, partial [Entomortierella lignicola]
MGIRGLAGIIKKSPSHIAGDLTGYTAHVDTQCLFYNLIRTRAYNVFSSKLNKARCENDNLDANSIVIGPSPKRPYDAVASATSPREVLTKKRRKDETFVESNLQQAVENIVNTSCPPGELYM